MTPEKNVEPPPAGRRVEPLVGPDLDAGDSLRLLLPVPADERQSAADDIAEAYAVVECDAPAGCIIYGFYHGRWIANVSCRWLVMRLLEGRREVREAHDGLCFDVETMPVDAMKRAVTIVRESLSRCF